MYPYEPEDPEEEEMICEGWCLEGGLTIIFFAYGYSEPDEDGRVFIPDPPEEGTCPFCGGRETTKL